MTGQPHVSVVIPTRNRAALVDRALRSVLGQSTSVPFEVVVVDNGSTDETSDVLAGWERSDARLRPHHEPAPGRAVALLEGMRVARGDLLLFTDDDVEIGEGWIDAYARFFARLDELVLAGGPVRPIPMAGTWPPWFSPQAAISLGAVDHDGERPLRVGEHVWGANMAAPAALFARFGGWDPTLGVRGDDHPGEPERNEDIELQYRVRDGGGAVWFCPGAIVGHRIEVPRPGRCLRRGFANGRNSAHRPVRPGQPEDRRRRPRTLGAGIALASALARSMTWSILFRSVRSSRVFGRAWSAAWSSGWRMEGVLDGGPHDAVDRAVRRVTGAVVGAAGRAAGL